MKGFATKTDTQNWMKSFTNWYNDEHLHSAIRFVTPNARHSGDDRETLATAPFSMHLLAHEIRNAGQEKPETGRLLDQYGLTQKPKTAPPKLETLHEYTGQLV